MTDIMEIYARRDAIRQRLLEIDLIEAQRYRNFTADGVSTPPEERAKLTLERAQLRIERDEVDKSLHAVKKAQTELNNTSFYQVLIRMLIERGDYELIREARRKAGILAGNTGVSNA